MKPDLFESGHMICHGSGQKVLGLSWTSFQITHHRGNNLHHIQAHTPFFSANSLFINKNRIFWICFMDLLLIGVGRFPSFYWVSPF